jgi:hypothetical protein
MGESTIWMATVLGIAILLTLATVEETLRHRSGGMRFQHELRRGADARRGRSAAPPPGFRPAPVRVPVQRPGRRHAA